jgi:hypothetical protein
MFEPLLVPPIKIGDADMDATKTIRITLNSDEDVIFMRPSPPSHILIEDSKCS